jgi:hypothetical protein
MDQSSGNSFSDARDKPCKTCKRGIMIAAGVFAAVFCASVYLLVRLYFSYGV